MFFSKTCYIHWPSSINIIKYEFPEMIEMNVLDTQIDKNNIKWSFWHIPPPNHHQIRDVYLYNDTIRILTVNIGLIYCTVIFDCNPLNKRLKICYYWTCEIHCGVHNSCYVFRIIYFYVWLQRKAFCPKNWK